MASKKKKNKNPEQNIFAKWLKNLKDETKRSILAVFVLVLALFLILADFQKAGIMGTYAYKILRIIFGAGFFLVPLSLFIASVSLLISERRHFVLNTIIGVALFLTSGLGAAEIVFGEKTGGYIGYLVSLSLLKLFDFWMSLILLFAVFVVSLLIILNTSIPAKFKKKEKPAAGEETGETIIEDSKDKNIGSAVKETLEKIKDAAKTEIAIHKKEEDKDLNLEPSKIKKIDFSPPPLDLLNEDKGKPSSGDIKAHSNIIKRTLQNFGIDVEMGEINIGPSVTQYTLKPAEGIKLSRIIALQNDLSLALAAHPIRIEAPIPGKSLVGIEIPNSAKTTVGMKNLLAEEVFQKSDYPLLIALGRDVSGKSVFANLGRMPHLLVAGATGAGKSISIHAVITSLLFKNSPESLRFIMIDPKRVELTVYNKIPHMLTPVITEAKKAILTLKWACGEMERRYESLLKSGVRDIGSYHEKKGNYNSMPYLIIIIDELADLMATYPREMEASVVRLAQMSRAVGIHLIVSTQRPSVEVITGLIKANITSRVALQVASQVDSRTILDMAGAEKLLGSGDMLYLAGDTAKPRRIQGPFVSEKEIKRVVNYLSEEYRDTGMEELTDEMEEGIGEALANGKMQGSLSFDFDEDIDDELYEESKDTVIKAGKASTSYLQRKLKIGYARAARLMDMLEERGIVGPADGAKPREVLVKNPDKEEEI